MSSSRELIILHGLGPLPVCLRLELPVHSCPVIAGSNKTHKTHAHACGMPAHCFYHIVLCEVGRRLKARRWAWVMCVTRNDLCWMPFVGRVHRFNNVPMSRRASLSLPTSPGWLLP